MKVYNEAVGKQVERAGMILSPFGKKFHFQTPLSLLACQERIDAICVTSSLLLNVYDEPVASRRKERFTLYSRKLGGAPSLDGVLTSELGRTHVRGRAGSNRTAFHSSIVVTLLTTGFLLLGAAVDDLNILTSLLLGPFVGACLYLRLWRDSRAEPLIGYLEQLLDASPVYQSPQL